MFWTTAQQDTKYEKAVVMVGSMKGEQKEENDIQETLEKMVSAE